jgi:hypothetical protein
MKCEDFVTAHETGSAVTRLRARLHARHCPQCATMQHRLSELRHVLGSPMDLTPYHRRVWERVAIDTAPAPARSWFTGPQLALAGSLTLAAAVVVAIVLSVGDQQTPDGGMIVKSVGPPPGIETQALAESAADLAALEAGLAQLEADLNKLADEAALLEARRAISELAALYPPLGSGDSS